ncbi:TetR/AcrR family transcriptional regulator [Mycobacterium sp. UM_CSW]|uniref:TetR/AcrR family transcriptional regulator n=1 Tax=Mycobacterium sp. UM_CSW TaxID=1370119 RepID=UPI00040D2BF2|nr:TetR/AcrR family transcriptional regulator [Mycobacterium sp. UM_CSW]
MEAACLLFDKQGVRATTLDEIGAAAGVGRGQLYHFFADKSDLVADVVGFQVERVISSIQPPFDAMSTADDVRAWCEDATRQAASSTDPVRCPIGSLVYQLDPDAVAARAALTAGFARWEEIFAKGLRRVADNGELLAGTDPSVLAAGLLAAYQGGLLLADVSGSVEPLRRALRTVTDAALAPRPKAKSRKG